MKYFLGLIFCLQVFSAVGQRYSEAIFLNQIGFFPKGPKVGMVSTATVASEFYIASTNLRDTFFRGKLSEETFTSRHSSITTRKADFSAFAQQGSFVLAVPGAGISAVFRIDDQVLADVGKACLKGFYFQRASMPLDYAYAGKWQRSVGHPDTEVLVHPSAASKSRPAGTPISSPGGWYDAGDYNKYIVNSGITVQTLLMAYTHYADYFARRQTGIPESGNPLPDILDETLYNLRWMLTMQDPADGGVYHKCTNAAFDDMVLPGITRAPRYVVQKSTAAALDFTAVMARAARVFAPFSKELPGLTDTCLQAAQKAWNWAVLHPGILYEQEKLNEQHQPPISTGTYGDGNIADEWLWAAAEMFRATDKTAYLQHIRDLDAASTLPSWNTVGLLAGYALLEAEKEAPEGYRDLWARMRANLLRLADAYLQYQPQSAFQVPMGQSDGDFVWGSNANAANQGILLLYAYRLTGLKAYLNAALANADYLLGRNATGYCFVTGFGSKSPMRPHHRQSVADGITEPVPGLLVGGPNPFRQDQCAYEYIDRETAFTDDDCSYASNEIAINWNAPAAYLFHALQALMEQK